jgi:hypothetical protein
MLTFGLAMAAGMVAQVLAWHLRVPGIVVLLVMGVGLGPDFLLADQRGSAQTSATTVGARRDIPPAASVWANGKARGAAPPKGRPMSRQCSSL